MSSPRSVAALCLVLTLTAASSQAQTQELSASRPAASEAPPEQAETLAQAVAAYDAGDLFTARILFEKVHAARPTARTLRSLGLVAFRQGRLDDAVALLEASLASVLKPLTPAQREGAQTVLLEARSKLAALREEGEQAAPEPAGPQRLQAEAATQSTEPPVAMSSRAPRTRSESAQEAFGRRRRVSYGLFATAAAALIVSAVSYGLGIARVREIEAACRRMDDMRCFAADVSRRERRANLDLLSGLGLSSAIVGGVALSAGTIVLLVRPATDRAGHRAFVGYRRSF